MRVSIRGLAARAMNRAYKQHRIKASYKIATLVADAHRHAIDTRTTPLGHPQKPNSPGTARRKGGRPPLYDRGDLYYPVLVPRSSGESVDVRPPQSRRSVVPLLHTMGYVTIWSEPPMIQGAQAVLDEEMARLRGEYYTQAEKVVK